ncbi:hypothetical protein JXJ21_19645 [candidate division KSB1 bacterium]|nr:hypothetical protein [candidate division KSB1 bacterium]
MRTSSPTETTGRYDIARPIRQSKCFLSLVLLLGFLFGAVVHAQEAGESIVAGKRLTIHSDILNEDREIFVSVPVRYGYSGTKYPVLYIMDGRGSFFFATSVTRFLSGTNRIPEMIVVAVPNTNRERDFTPTAVINRPGTGGAGNFLKFLHKELFPYIEKNYQTQPYRIFSGHSLCGMFAIYTLMNQPDLFNAYIAMSPYLMYDQNFVYNYAVNKIKKTKKLQKRLFMSLGNEPEYFETLDNFTALLTESRLQDFEWTMERMENDTHASVPLKSLYQGLEFIFSDYPLPKGTPLELTDVDAHYKSLAKKYGYEIDVPEGLINRFGYQLLTGGKTDSAIKLFKLNVKKYPKSANVYDSLGEGYEAKGELELAKENYIEAIKLGEQTDDPNTPVYHQHLEKITQKLNGEQTQ